MDLLPGQVTALVGESGSGKSMTSLAIMGLLPPKALTTGEVLLDGANLLADRHAQQLARGRDMTMIFQEPMSCLNPVRRIGSQATEGLRLGGMTQKQAEEEMLTLFHQVQLPRPEALLRSYPHQLSGGQLQRVMIAMALSTRPRLILADEPTTALDVSVQQEILALCRTLVEGQERSMLFVSHDLRLVQQLAHRVVVLYQGRVVEQGEAAQVLSSPAHPYTQALLQCRPTTAHRGYRLPTVTDFTSVETPPEPVPLPPSTAGEVLLRVDGLAKTYPGKPPVTALTDTQLELRAGETLGLVGESGCGKSTLARILAGLEAPTAGTVLYKGVPLPPQPRPKALVRAVQMVFQDPSGSLNPRRAIGQTLAEPLQVHGLCTGPQAVQQRVLQLLQQVGLPTDYATRYPYQLSGGQCQRVGIARALALAPQVLVCDESVAALDVSVQAQVLNLLNDLKKELGLALLFVSHDLAVVHYMADHIAVMDGGRIVEYGTPDAVLHHPQADLTKRMVAAAQ